MAVGFCTRCRHEVHVGGCHPRVSGTEVLDVEKETHARIPLSAGVYTVASVQ